MVAADIRRLLTRFLFTQYPDDLFFREPRCFISISSQVDGLYLKMEEDSGCTSITISFAMKMQVHTTKCDKHLTAFAFSICATSTD